MTIINQLVSMPTKLQEAVNRYLETYTGSKVLTIETYQSTPYKDKAIINTRYSAYLEYGNLLTVLSITDCTKPEWSDSEVKESSMIAGDIQVFIENSWWFSKQIKK